MIPNSIIDRLTSQPYSSMIISDFGDPVDNVYTLNTMCKAAELSNEGVDGVLEIHLVDDAEDRWYLMPLLSGQRNSAIFDKIRTTNTTVNLIFVTCFKI
jgi:hypothetical protein